MASQHLIEIKDILFDVIEEIDEAIGYESDKEEDEAENGNEGSQSKKIWDENIFEKISCFSPSVPRLQNLKIGGLERIAHTQTRKECLAYDILIHTFNIMSSSLRKIDSPLSSFYFL